MRFENRSRKLVIDKAHRRTTQTVIGYGDWVPSIGKENKVDLLRSG